MVSFGFDFRFSMSSQPNSRLSSQKADRSSGVCSICRTVRHILRDGTIHMHGPHNNRCPGSYKRPLATPVAVPGNSTQTQNLSTSLPPNSDSQQPQLTVPSAPVLPSTSHPATIVDNTSPIWKPITFGLIKRIPQSARLQCTLHLKELLNSVSDKPEDADAWVSLLNWGGLILQPIKRGGKRHNLTTIIKKRISSYTDSTPPIRATPSVRPADPATQLRQAVASKLEDGNLRAAIRILCSDDAPLPVSEDSLAQLQFKHPHATPLASCLPELTLPSLSLDESGVRSAILSFPAGSSGGPDGLRPQHLKDMLSIDLEGVGFLSALTGFVNTVLAGHCPAAIVPFFFGGRLIALKKKAGGIRPIAIGNTLRRLVSKCASSFGIGCLGEYFHPHQLGVGTPSGCEAAIHSARRYLSSLPAGHVLVKLDFSNAFNNIRRSDMLLAVRDRLPELFSYCFSSYGSSSFLFFGDKIILSQEGTQQGDPLGPLLFCNTIHPLLESLQSTLNLDYLDDVTLGGPMHVVASDVQRVVNIGTQMGLYLNLSKCEIVSHPDTAVNDPLLQSFIPVGISDACLLGAPLFIGPSLDEAWLKRCEDLRRATERLKSIDAQDALILLRVSFSAPRVQHLLRCSPSADHPALQSFDDLLRSAVCNITNCDLTDMQWLQASLPIKDGGLGIRRVSTLALPAFLASAAGTQSLQATILSESQSVPDEVFEKCLLTWNQSGLPQPEAPLNKKQSYWDRPGIDCVKAQIKESMTDATSHARFLAALADHSGDWLLALPIAQCGLKLDNEAVRVAVSLRLGLNLGAPHICRCGTLVDATGLHAFVCKHAPGRIIRHQSLNDVVTRALIRATYPSSKEPSGLSRQDGKRPDGMTLVPWQAGKLLIWDVTVISVLARSYVNIASQGTGRAVELAAARKEEKYANLSSDYIFKPLAFENLGALNQSAYDFFSSLGSKLTEVTGEPRETSFLFQRLSVHLQRFNSVLFKDSFPDSFSEPDL